jgi:hypothetical protein
MCAGEISIQGGQERLEPGYMFSYMIYPALVKIGEFHFRLGILPFGQ